MKEIRNGARNARNYLERDARRPHLTSHQRDLLNIRLEFLDERRRNNAERLEEATALRGVHQLIAQRARARGGADRMQAILAPVSRGPRPNPMPLGRSGASVSGGRGHGGRGRVVVGDARALIRQNDMRR
jgi:hypothetical protein